MIEANTCTTLGANETLKRRKKEESGYKAVLFHRNVAKWLKWAIFGCVRNQ